MNNPLRNQRFLYLLLPLVGGLPLLAYVAHADPFSGDHAASEVCGVKLQNRRSTNEQDNYG